MEGQSFLGHHVLLKSPIGEFQGTIRCVDTDNQTITLKEPLQNGKSMPTDEVTILASDIEDLQFLPREMAYSSAQQQHRPSTPPNNILPQCNTPNNTPATPHNSAKKDLRPKGGHSYSEQRRGQNQLHVGREEANRRRNRSTTDWLDNADDYSQDYDFQSNNLKFDKLAFYDDHVGNDGEIRTPNKNTYRSEPKFGHDEMIIQSQPVTYRQIKGNAMTDSEYYTDNGLVIPCVTTETRSQLCESAHNMGFTYSRQFEVFGINSSQMLISVLGGANRLRPLNQHQLPHVVILAGNGVVGIRGISLGRHISNQNLHVTVLLVPASSHEKTKLDSYLAEEVRLISLTSAKLIKDPKALPDMPVDLVVTAIDKSQQLNRHITTWCLRSNAPNMCISPSESADIGMDMKIKWSICPVLPSELSENYGSVYLIDQCFTPKMFKQLDIKYKSPFCGKAFIPLHSGH